jgi:hypothetical protein
MRLGSTKGESISVGKHAYARGFKADFKATVFFLLKVKSMFLKFEATPETKAPYTRSKMKPGFQIVTGAYSYM